MYRLLILLLAASTQSIVYGASADKTIQIKLIDTAGVAVCKEYPEEQIHKIALVNHIFQDLPETEEALSLPLEQATPDDFDLLVQLANASKRSADRYKIENQLKQDDQQLVRLINLARRYNPLDETLAVYTFLQVIKSLPIQNRYFLHNHDVITLYNGCRAICEDQAYTQEEKRESIQGLLKLQELAQCITNKQAELLINIIKKEAWSYAKKTGEWQEAIKAYLYGKYASYGTFPVVPNEQTGMPEEGYFPISIQDLNKANPEATLEAITTGLIHNVHNGLCLSINGKGKYLTSLDGLSTILDCELLQELDLHEITMAYLMPNTFLGVSKLKKLTLHQESHKNGIKEIKANAFERLSSLEYLSLDACNMMHIEEGAFRGLKALRELRLNWTAVNLVRKGIFEGLSALTNLDLSKAKIYCLETNMFEGLRALKKLSLSNCSIRRIKEHSFTSLRSLEELDLSHNPLQSLAPNMLMTSSLNGLQKLNVSCCDIETIDYKLFAHSHYLQELTLSGNNFNKIKLEMFVGLSSLKSLLLADCKIKKIDPKTFEVCPQLEVLDLSNNQLSRVIPEMFAGLALLEKLDLSTCQIEEIQGKSLKPLKSLKQLNVNNNHLTQDKNSIRGLLPGKTQDSCSVVYGQQQK